MLGCLHLLPNPENGRSTLTSNVNALVYDAALAPAMALHVFPLLLLVRLDELELLLGALGNRVVDPLVDSV